MSKLYEIREGMSIKVPPYVLWILKSLDFVLDALPNDNRLIADPLAGWWHHYVFKYGKIDAGGYFVNEGVKNAKRNA